MSWDARNGILGDELFLTCIEFILASWLSFYTTYVAKLKIHLSEIVKKTIDTFYELLCGYYIGTNLKFNLENTICNISRLQWLLTIIQGTLMSGF